MSQEDELPLNSEKILYKFDSNECGYIEITQDIIVIHFPEKSLPEKTFSNQEIQLFVDKTLVLHSNWLPIHSTSDYFKCKTMFLQSYQMYCNAVQQSFYSPNSYYPYYSDEIVTNIKNKSFSIYSFENPTICSVEIDVYKDITLEHPCSTFPLHIFIGNNKIFDSNRDLNQCSTENIYFIIQFVLAKLSKY